jgi:hypothetical protein
MRLTSIAFMKHDVPDDASPLILDNTHDVSSVSMPSAVVGPQLPSVACILPCCGQFGWFQRSSVKEALVFSSRVIVGRIPAGRHILDHESYRCFVVKQADGLACIVFGDKEYPTRVAFSLLRTLLEEFVEMHRDGWKSAARDHQFPFPGLASVMVEYQTPERVDSIMRIQASLTETRSVMVMPPPLWSPAFAGFSPEAARAFRRCKTLTRCWHAAPSWMTL